MEIKIFSDKLNLLIPKGKVPEPIVNGFEFIEGPVWSEVKGCLYFSDIPANIIYTWNPEQGLLKYRDPSGNSNGLTIDHNGDLLTCEHSNRRITRTDMDGKVHIVANEYCGKKLNSPNDIIVKSDGTIYFTDPPYGLIDLDQLDKQEQPHQGVYKLDTSTGTLTLLVDDFDRPNGLAFSPDEKIIYIDDSAHQHVRAFNVKTDGTLENSRVFAQLDADVGAGVPDGMKVDIQGNIYVTGPGGVWVISPEGEQLGIIRLPEVAANVGWGEDGHSLFITATSTLYRIRLNVPGWC